MLHSWVFPSFPKEKCVLNYYRDCCSGEIFEDKGQCCHIFCLVFYLFQITKPSATSFENLVGFFQKFLKVSSFNNDQQKNKFDFDLKDHEWRSQLQIVHLNYILNYLTILVVILICGTIWEELILFFSIPNMYYIPYY